MSSPDDTGLFLMGVLASAREYILDAKETAKTPELAAIYDLWLNDAYPEALTMCMDMVRLPAHDDEARS